MKKTMMDLSTSSTTITYTCDANETIATYICDDKLICSILINNGGYGAFYELQIHTNITQQRHCELITKAINDKFKLENNISIIN